MKAIHQTTQTKLLYTLPLTAILIFTILYIVVYVSHTTANTHAEAEVLDSNTTSAFTLSSDRSLTVSVSSANIDLTLTPTAEGIFNSTSETPLTVTVSTNNATGYNLNMTTTTTDLTRTASLSGHYPVINTLSGSGSFTSETFEDNAWGYSLDGDNFTAMKLATQINQTTKEANSSATNIIFGAKLNNEIPHGSYRSTITFIATTNPLDATFDTAFDAAGKTQVSYNGNNYYKMQDMSGFICNMVATPTNTTSAESTQLIDIRDNSIYWVSKLLDGRCWMIENLDFEGSTLAPDDSNVTNNISLEWYDLADNSECNARMNSFNNACIKEASQGNWYNYAGASAMTIIGQYNTTENIENICPAGWTLPTHSENNSLVGVIGDSPSTFSPIIGGTYAGSSIQRDTTGFWWSATNDPSNYEDRMTLIYENEKLSTVNNSDGRWRGMYVRCIARTDQTIEDAVYLQDVTPEMRQNTTIGTTVTVKDSRDNEEYTIGKLADGNIWLLNNLRFTETELSPSTSNVTTNTTIGWKDLSSDADCTNYSSSYSTPCMVESEEHGVYYNYTAATANTITAYNNATEATQDLCPAGWKMPSMDSALNLVSFIQRNPSSFMPTVGGYYRAGVITDAHLGFWWTTTAFSVEDESADEFQRAYLLYNGNVNQLYRRSGARVFGHFIRCILK